MARGDVDRNIGDICFIDGQTLDERAICVARENRLDEQETKDFVEYVKKRFPHQLKSRGGLHYIEEWADRFRWGKEYRLSDLEGQRLLEKINPGKYGKDKTCNKPW